MREIKFRGYVVEEMEGCNQWVEGFGFMFSEFSDEYAKEVGRNGDYILYTHHGFYVVHESSIGQYTGSKDKNGREIYEGDITIDGYGTVTIIENDGFQWLERVLRLRDLQLHKEIFSMTKNNATICEVIGNIFENPELLLEEKTHD